MKRIILLHILSIISYSGVFALSFQDARREALFLTDKMAFELNLSHTQYDHVYQVNLEYFLHINSSRDCRGRYWDYRNADLFYILYDWQYTTYKNTVYFFAPLKWINDAWHFDIYKYYRKGCHFFNRPQCYSTYYGGNWRARKPHMSSPYKEYHFKSGIGMRDQYHKEQPTNSSHHPVYQQREVRKDNNLPSVNRRNNKQQSITTKPNRKSSSIVTSSPKRGVSKSSNKKQSSRENHRREMMR